MQILKKPSEYMLVILGLLFQGESWASSEIHTQLIKIMDGKHPARASVINFLNLLVDNHHATFKHEACQGGPRRIYTLKGNREDFTNRLTQQMNLQFGELYLGPLEAV